MFMRKRSRSEIPLTLGQFAEAIGVSYASAWMMAATGKLNPCFDEPIGKRKRIRRFGRSEVDRVRGLIALGLPITRDAIPDKVQIV